MKRWVQVTLLVALATMISPLAAQAQPAARAKQPRIGFYGWGLRGGATADPDQVHVGFHIDAGRLAPRVRLQPSFDLGFGDHRTVGSIQLDAFYVFRVRGFNPYAGGGLGLALVDFDGDRGRGDGFDVEAGLNLVGGLEWGRNPRYLLELRAGLGDIPDLKVTAGLTF